MNTTVPNPIPIPIPPADPNLPPPSLFEIPEFHMWTKLRPGVREFLEASSRLFQLAVYTNGERGYAEAMARLLDPGGGLFEGRVISHGDSTRQGMKDLDVVLGEERAVLILDDTEQVGGCGIF